jgi:oligopeptide transport system permease protein
VRSLFGLRLSLTIACFAALIDLLFGASFGIIATIKGGLFEKSLFWFVDFLNCFPYLLISMTLTLCLGGGLLALIASLAAFGWMTQARTVRGVLQETLKQDYIVASTLLGTTPHQITYTHLLPHLKKPVLSTLSLHIPACIFSEAFLSFLGLGVKPPTASLGTMIQEGLPAMQYYPWRVAFPAALLTLTLFAFNLLSYKMEKELA